MKIDTLIRNLMNDDGESSIDKTAEDRLLDQLRERGQVQENPYADMSDEDFLKLAEEVLGESPETVDDEAVKLAEDDQRGKIMAHAFVHELGLAKEAMLNGRCRVCKTQAFDVEGSSICSSCQPTE